MQRFTINELNSMSNKKFAALILSEELGKRGNPYTPIANKLRSAISELEGDAEKQMPRILTQQEVFSTDFDGHVYVEILGVITPALVTWKTREIKQNWFATPRKVTERFIATQQLEGNWLVEEDYGITWRCWNIMPSAEDCKNAPWDVQESNQAGSEDPKAKKCEEKMLSDIYLAASDELDRVKKDTVMVDQLVKDTAGKDPRIDPTKLTYDVNISQNGEIVETHRIVGLGKAHEFGEKRIKELGGDAGYGVWLR